MDNVIGENVEAVGCSYCVPSSLLTIRYNRVKSQAEIMTRIPRTVSRIKTVWRLAHSSGLNAFFESVTQFLLLLHASERGSDTDSDPLRLGRRDRRLSGFAYGGVHAAERYHDPSGRRFRSRQDIEIQAW